MKKILPLLPILFLIYWGCDEATKGEGNFPTPVTLYIDTLDVLRWDMNENTDFFRYSLYGSNNSSMENKTLIYETQTRLDTTYTLDSSEYFYYFQVDVMNLNKYISSSNIIKVFVELWGEYYSMENTTELNLSNSGLTGEIPPEIGNLTNLSYLYLFSNQLTGEIPSEMWNLTNLKLLYLRNNQLTGSIPSEIGNLTNLITLRLGINQLTGEIPSEIGNLTNLTYLNLWNNQLTGNIPESIWDLVGLVRIDLDVNQLTGSIPPEIGNLTNLERLYLYENELTGSIPPEIGNLTNLTHLDLRSNQLTGSIPESICELTNLNWSPDFIDWYYSYLYNNQLCPPYPSCIEDYVGEQDTSDCP
jgi:Leucine-rich repeat (LRR) protein